MFVWGEDALNWGGNALRHWNTESGFIMPWAKNLLFSQRKSIVSSHVASPNVANKGLSWTIPTPDLIVNRNIKWSFLWDCYRNCFSHAYTPTERRNMGRNLVQVLSVQLWNKKEKKKKWFLSIDICSWLSRDRKTPAPRRAGVKSDAFSILSIIWWSVLELLACLLYSRLLSLIAVLHAGERNPQRIHFSTESGKRAAVEASISPLQSNSESRGAYTCDFTWLWLYACVQYVQ